MRSTALRRMSHLASKFVGGSELHVIDPQVDLRYVFSNSTALHRNVAARGVPLDISQVEEKYTNWWTKYEKYLEIKKDKDKKSESILARRELREAKDGLIQALSLPNTPRIEALNAPSVKKVPYETAHPQFLAREGLVRLDKETEVVHLVGYLPTMLNSLSNTFLMAFPTAVLISPPHMVRAAVMEGVNERLEEFCINSTFTDGGSSFPLTYLTGHSLPSLVSLFLRAKFSSSTNEWPMCMQSTGMAYYAKNGRYDLISCRQRQKYVQLLMCQNEKEMELAVQSAKSVVEMILGDRLELSCKPRECSAAELKNYESAGSTFEIENVEVARVSMIGDYISRRVNVQSDKDFVHMGFVEVDLYRLLAKIVDLTMKENKGKKISWKDYPALLRQGLDNS